MHRSTHWFLLFASTSLLLTAGCTLRGTTESISDTTNNITVSTSGRIWWNEDGLLQPAHKAIAFAAYNGANLEQDMAQGQGEYLASLGALLGTDERTSASFNTRAQEHFLTLMPADHAVRVQRLGGLAR